MKAFVDLFLGLDQTSKTNEKVQLLINFFRNVSDEDKMWCIALLSDKRPPRPLNTTILKEMAADLANLPFWMIDESHHIVGDLSETIALLVPQTSIGSEKSLSVWMNEISTLKERSEEERKRYIQEAWLGLNRNEKFVFNKWIGGGFRMGVSRQLVARAISIFTGISQDNVLQRLMDKWDPNTTLFADWMSPEKNQSNEASPIPFYLAHPMEKLEELGAVEDWIFEWKWDGIRGQVVHRNQKSFIWSRGEDLMTERFPELILSNETKKSFVMDGEIMVHDGLRPLPFALLQTRIGRKKISAKILKEAPIKFVAYDLLEYDGEDIRHLPTIKRKELLHQLIIELNHPAYLESEVFTFNNWDEAILFRSKSRENFAEGLMIKLKSGDYKVGRKRGQWWKWKLEALTIDAVMIYAMRGHGRRANLFTDFTFAVKDGEQLIPFTKAYSGLTDSEMKEVDAFVKKNTLEKFGPVRSVAPELVFEIAFEGIQKSSRHKSGIALRFPRIHRWRKDKSPQEANSMEDLLALLNQYGG